jgi:hypothetical protein
MARVLVFAMLGVLLPCLAMAQQLSNKVTIIPDKGMFVHPTDANSVGTFIPTGKMTIPGKSNQENIGDYCTWCQCCTDTDKARLVKQLNDAKRPDIASDAAISKSVDVDLAKIPRQ